MSDTLLVYTLTWKSSREDRYESNMNDRARVVAESVPGVEILDQFGGCAIGPGSGDLPADNGLEVRCPVEAAGTLARLLDVVVGYPVTLAEAEA